MLQKKFQFIVIALFLLIILAVPVYWMIPGRTVIKYSWIENRNLEPFPVLPLKNIKVMVKRLWQGFPREASDLAINLFYDSRDLAINVLNERGFQKKIEMAANDQFPYRITMIQHVKSMDRVMIRMAYLFLRDPAIPADNKSGVLVTRDEQMMIYPPAVFNASTKANVDARIQNYAELITQNPGIKFFIFYHERLSYSPYHPLNLYFPDADRGQTFDYFESHKPEGLILGKMMLNSMDDHLRYYFRTDHHWNIHGSWKAYEEIYKLIAAHYPEISPKLQLTGLITFPGLTYDGSLARKTFYPIKPDKFEVAEIQLPPYKTYSNDGKEIEYNKEKKYRAGTYRTDPYIDHYGNYFGTNPDLIKYVSKNDALRNLLLIGSSFTTPITPWIAAHYQNTYRIDLRHYTLISLKNFIEQYDIDDVLVIGDIIAIGDPDWMINP